MKALTSSGTARNLGDPCFRFNAVTRLVSATRAQLDSLPPIPFLHDTTTKNVIVTPGGTFSGIVDVDDLCFGDPRYVVALTLASTLNSTNNPGKVGIACHTAERFDVDFTDVKSFPFVTLLRFP
jgi:aminoglycoside phosphotransferase (APT) family kinase protein